MDEIELEHSAPATTSWQAPDDRTAEERTEHITNARKQILDGMLADIDAAHAAGISAELLNVLIYDYLLFRFTRRRVWDELYVTDKKNPAFPKRFWPETAWERARLTDKLDRVHDLWLRICHGRCPKVGGCADINDYVALPGKDGQIVPLSGYLKFLVKRRGSNYDKAERLHAERNVGVAEAYGPRAAKLTYDRAIDIAKMKLDPVERQKLAWVFNAIPSFNEDETIATIDHQRAAKRLKAHREAFLATDIGGMLLRDHTPVVQIASALGLSRKRVKRLADEYRAGVLGIMAGATDVEDYALRLLSSRKYPKRVEGMTA